MEYPLIHVIFCSPSLSGSGNTRAFEPVPGWNPQQVIIKILDEVASTHSEKSGAILDPKNMFRQSTVLACMRVTDLRRKE
jgi:hypothetical protein